MVPRKNSPLYTKVCVVASFFVGGCVIVDEKKKNRLNKLEYYKRRRLYEIFEIIYENSKNC